MPSPPTEPFNPYFHYLRMMKTVYGPTFHLTRDQWDAMISAPRPRYSDPDFDIDTERRDGWG